VLEVELSHGSLQSEGEVTSLTGRNVIAVEGSGGWELVSFASAVLTGTRQWRLSGLIRGLGGTEPYAADAKPAGARAVLLDGAVQPLVSGPAELGRQTFWRIAPVDRDHADPMAIAFSTTATGVALLPLAPVRLRAHRVAGGLLLSWIRRVRSGGDSWELAEVPLGEAAEAYVVEVLGGTAIKRSAEVAGPSWLYAAADEIADFGVPQAQLRFRVRQISQAAGPGRAAETLASVG
jgi:hypothetical protein